MQHRLCASLLFAGCLAQALTACIWEDRCVNGAERVDGECVLVDAGADAGTEDGSPADAPGEAGGHDASPDATTPDETAPTVVETVPSDGTNGVETDIVVRAVFSEGVDESSLTTESFYVQGAVAVEGAIEYDDPAHAVNLTPMDGLGLLRGYNANLTTGVTDRVGNALAREYRWTFNTRDGSWSTPTFVERESGDASSADIDTDRSGNVVAVWVQSDGTRDNVWSGQLVVGTPWDTSRLIESDDGNASSPRVAVDEAGNALAVWQQNDGTLENVWFNRLEAGAGWGTAELIETDDRGDASSPRVGVDSDGNAILIWRQHDGERHNLWGKRYAVGTGWETAELIETDDAGSVDHPVLAVDGSGNAVAVWQQWDGTRQNMWSAESSPGGGWQAAELIETHDGGNAESPAVSMHSGVAVAVWLQYDGRTNVWANRFVLGTGWAEAEKIGTLEPVFPRDLVVSINGDGIAVAVWRQRDAPTGPQNVRAARYEPGTGWSSPQLIEVDGGDAVEPAIVVDSVGHAVAAWAQTDGVRYSIWANRYANGTGWQGPALLESGDEHAVQARLVVDHLGRTTAVWTQGDGIDLDLWSSRFQ